MFTLDIEFFRDLQGLPSPPYQIVSILDEVGQATFDDFDIIRIIRNDPSIACRILQVANTPLYGYPAKISSLQQASGLLGPGPIKNIVLMTPVLERFGVNHCAESGLDCIKLWQRSSVMAEVAGHLGRLLPHFESDVCYTAGLIHDIGKIALVVYHSPIMSQIAEQAAKNNIPLIQAENERIGWSHADLAMKMAESWGFPDVLIQTLKNSSDKEIHEGKDKLAGVVYLAEHLANEWDFHDGIHPHKNPLPEKLLSWLEITTQDLEKWMPELKQTAEHAAKDHE